jgi:hypothetical protein
MVQVPAAFGVTDEPLTVQTVVEVEVKFTSRPDVAAAVRVTTAAGKVTSLRGLKLMLCGVFVTVID